MRTRLVLLDKEFRQFFRNPFLPKMAVLFPLAIMLVFPWVTTMDVRHVGVAVVDNDRSTASQRLIRKLETSEYFTLFGVSDRYGPMIEELEAGRVDVILEIPDDFERSLSEGTPKRVSISANGVNAVKGNLGTQYLTGAFTKVIGELRAELGRPAVVYQIVVLNRFNPTLEYRFYMIPALMIMLIIMLCGFLPALFILTMSGLGMIVANNSTTMQQTMFVMFFFVMIFVLMSGLITPVESILGWAQRITRFLPPRYFIDAMRSVYLKGTPLVELWPDYLALVAFAVVFNTLAALSYKKRG